MYQIPYSLLYSNHTIKPYWFYLINFLSFLLFCVKARKIRNWHITIYEYEKSQAPGGKVVRTIFKLG